MWLVNPCLSGSTRNLLAFVIETHTSLPRESITLTVADTAVEYTPGASGRRDVDLLLRKRGNHTMLTDLIYLSGMQSSLQASNDLALMFSCAPSIVEGFLRAKTLVGFQKSTAELLTETQEKRIRKLESLVAKLKSRRGGLNVGKKRP